MLSNKVDINFKCMLQYVLEVCGLNVGLVFDNRKNGLDIFININYYISVVDCKDLQVTKHLMFLLYNICLSLFLTFIT